MIDTFVSSGVFKVFKGRRAWPPLFRAPIEVFYAKIFLSFGEKLIIHSYNPTKEIMRKYSAFKRTHSSYNV